jgi:hypothetical protein
MPEIGTSGSMSGEGKRSVAEWPKLPRPSSTLPQRKPLVGISLNIYRHTDLAGERRYAVEMFGHRTIKIAREESLVAHGPVSRR